MIVTNVKQRIGLTVTFLASGFGLMFGTVLSPATAPANTLTLNSGVYRDTQESARRSLSIDIGLALIKPLGPLDRTDVTIALTRDLLERREDQSEPGSDLEQATYENLRFGLTQTWNALTETRFAVDVASEADAAAQRGSVGISQWLLKETLQISLDGSRNLGEQQQQVLVDRDYETLRIPRDTDASSIDFGLRHLATRTTIIDYGAGYTSIDDRPDLSRYSLGAKQFVPMTESALHGKATRFQSHGQPTLKSTVGQIDGWEFEIEFLQSLWARAAAQLGYRYYREDETTRAFGNQYTLGSDAIAVGMRQGFGEQGRQVGEDKYVLLAKASRYLTNRNVRADSYEVGVGTRF